MSLIAYKQMQLFEKQNQAAGMIQASIKYIKARMGSNQVD